MLANVFNVRPGGIKMPFNDNDFMELARCWTAFADPLGRVLQMTFVNV